MARVCHTLSDQTALIILEQVTERCPSERPSRHPSMCAQALAKRNSGFRRSCRLVGLRVGTVCFIPGANE
jgi:hypothetical protein